MIHGKYTTYNNHACRCSACAEANRLEQRRKNAARVLRSANAPHGTYGGYTNWGCRCSACTEAHTIQQRRYRQQRATS